MTTHLPPDRLHHKGDTGASGPLAFSSPSCACCANFGGRYALGAASSVVSGSSQQMGTRWPPLSHDPLKAFDHVACQNLTDAAERTGFPPRQLRLLVQPCQGSRPVELEGVDEQLRAQRGIIPGCAFATTLLQLLLLRPL